MTATYVCTVNMASGATTVQVVYSTHCPTTFTTPSTASAGTQVATKFAQLRTYGGGDWPSWR
jgi:hypothetical protein